MKRIVVLLATMLLSFGLISAQNEVDIAVEGMVLDTLRVGVPATLDVYLANDYVLGGMSLGFQIWGTGATWSWNNVGGVGASGFVSLVDGTRLAGGDVFDMTGLLITEQDIDEAGRDTLMAGGVALMLGLPTGPLDHLYSYNFTPGGGADPDVGRADRPAAHPPAGPGRPGSRLGSVPGRRC